VRDEDGQVSLPIGVTQNRGLYMAAEVQTGDKVILLATTQTALVSHIATAIRSELQQVPKSGTVAGCVGRGVRHIPHSGRQRHDPPCS